jgi:CHAT domain-containing protein
LYFHVGDSQSALWVLTSRQFQLYKLPPRSQLEDIINRFERSIKGDKPDATALGQQLYSMLFGAVDAKTLATRHWILCTDGQLSLVPFAALVTSPAGEPGHPHYLVEEHSIEFVPNNSALTHSKTAVTNRRFIGVGDPIYNRADPRLHVQAGLARILHPPQPSGLELARLGGSGREIETSAAIWRARGYQASILEGRDATRQNLMAALPAGAAVVHIAAHLVAPESFAFSAIALSLQPEGPLEILSTTDIAATPAATDLVILDACGSGSGLIRPGAGVMGMARAWLAAGAHTVVATHWEITDADSGSFIETFYDHLSNSGDPIRMRSVAEALRAAQLAALSAGDWRSKPFYWATYFCTGRN